MNDFRCRCCNRLLAKFEECKLIEIKCPKCKTINMFRDNEIILVQLGQKYINRTPDIDPVAS
ncbi:Com family DNA-binding transcriptional regulator [Candidatus Margulisiibacteriota bacterium]